MAIKYCIVCNKQLGQKTKGNLCIAHLNKTPEKREISRLGQFGKKHTVKRQPRMKKFCEVCNIKLNKSTKGNLCIHHSIQTSERRDVSRKNQLGKHHTAETKQKISLAKSGKNHHYYGKSFSNEHKQKLSLAHLGKKLSEEHKKKIGEKVSGERNGMFGKLKELNPLWKGGEYIAFVRHNAKRRALGHDALNEEFEGSEAHHIDKEHVVFIPKKLHRSIWHSQSKPDTMAQINTKVFCWLLGRIE